MFGMARVLLGVTGGIAAYKAAELARLLVRAGHEVTPILTDEAETFVTAKTFAHSPQSQKYLCGDECIGKPPSSPSSRLVSHVSNSRR